MTVSCPIHDSNVIEEPTKAYLVNPVAVAHAVCSHLSRALYSEQTFLLHLSKDFQSKNKEFCLTFCARGLHVAFSC